MGPASFFLPLAGTLIKVGLSAALLVGMLSGAKRIYQAGFDAASQEALVRELQAKEQARALSAKLVQAQMDKHRRMDHETQRALALARERADASRDDLERLRGKLATLSSNPVRADPGDTTSSCDGIRAERDRLAALLAEGAGLVAEGQQRGDELAVRLEGNRLKAR
jgi:hypothetical protein